jgi:hypothetical protein
MAEREEMMEEREELLSTLDDDTRTALEELQADYKEAMANFKEVSPTDITKEESVERTAEYQEMKKTHQAAVAELLADYPAVLEAMNERKEDMGEKDGKMNRK